jgi:ZIP family zinc transporter
MTKPTKDFLVIIASGIFIGAALFDVLPETADQLRLMPSLGWLMLGLLIWYLLKKLADVFSQSGFIIVASLAFWFHSFLEGAVTALSFSAGFTTGLIVSLGMILHLVPEFFAITTILKGEGMTTKRSVVIDIAGIGVLVISFLIIRLLLGGVSAHGLAILAAVSGGAFVYIGASSFLKRPKTSTNFIGLLIGLAVVGLWTLIKH